MNSIELLKALTALSKNEDLVKIRSRLQSFEKTFASIDKEARGIFGLLESLSKAKSIILDKEDKEFLRQQLADLKDRLEHQTYGDCAAWGITPGFISFGIVIARISEVGRRTLKNTLEKISVWIKVCTILPALNKLKKKIELLRDAMIKLSEISNLDKKDIEILNNLAEQFSALSLEAEKTGDPVLIKFLNKVSSQGGATLEDLSEDTLGLLEKHQLKKLIKIQLAQNAQ